MNCQAPHIAIVTFICLFSAAFSPLIGAEKSPEPFAGAVARGKDGTSFYTVVQRGQLTLHLGDPDADTLSVRPGESVALVGDDQALLNSKAAGPGVALLVTEKDRLILAWSIEEKTYVSSCSLMRNSIRALESKNYTEPLEIGPGVPVSSASNPLHDRAVLTGYSPDEGGAIWVARQKADGWDYETVVVNQGQTLPQISVSSLGIIHLTWRDSSGAVWHLENKADDGQTSQWLRSGGTSKQPELIGQSSETPSMTTTRHQLLVAMTTASEQIEYSLYTGQSWEKNQPCTEIDKRWGNDTLSQPRLTVDGVGVPWLFFVNNTEKRQYLYYTRWLGFDWDTIREARGIFHVSEEFLDCLAPIESYFLPGTISPDDREISLLLVNRDLPQPLRPFRIATPTPVARPGADILFLDMLDVARSYWTEQVLQTAEKHPDSPLLRPSGDPETLDSHRVFNGGNILKDDGIYKAWYGSVNPTGDWFADNGLAWKSMLHLCYATSTDGITWTKPNLGLYNFKGNTNNNGLGLSLELSSELRFFHGPIRVMRNPDQSDAKRAYLSVPPGYYSDDGLKWNKQDVTFDRPGPSPKWVDFHSIIVDPDAPASRRWKAYGCTCTNEPPVLRSICYAYSADGVHWTEDAENPILLAETGGFWNKAHDVGTCRYKGHYLMLYQTGDGYDQHLELATSRDGRNFVRVHDGQPVIEQGPGDAFDRGLHLPVDPVIGDDGIRLYYGAADYRAPDDPPFEFERWKNCKIQLGLATLPVDGWTYVRNLPSRHVGYITTVPMRYENLQNGVLTLNVQCRDKGHFLVELLDGNTSDRIPGYEMENCDHVDTTGTAQVVSWKGNAGLGNIDCDQFRVRVVFVGLGDAVRLYSIGIREDKVAMAPQPEETASGLIEESLVYSSSVSNLSSLKSWIAHRPDGKRKPVLVLMHGFGERIYRHGGRRLKGSVQYYAKKGVFAIGVDLRGREESAGQRDNGGLEVMDIYDAVQAVLEKYPDEADNECVNILGWSGGGGNAFSAVTRMPDLFSNAGAFYGITDYGHWANTAFKGAVEADIGGTPQQVPDRYAARNSLLGVANNAYTNFHFFWDEDETICPAWMDEEYRRLAKELKRDNITAHESLRTDEFRWLHAGGSRESAVEAERLLTPLFVDGHNPGRQIEASGNLTIPGYIMTKRFKSLFGQGNDTVVGLDYDLRDAAYEFRFNLQTTDRSVFGWLKVTDRLAVDVTSVKLNGSDHPWQPTEDGRIVVRDIAPQDTLTIQFRSTPQ